MKKIAIVLLLIGGSLASQAQQRVFTKSGKIMFDATSPSSPEKISAVNEKAYSVLDVSNGNLEFMLLMKAFSFEKALMQEHFNENYVESDKFPKATFKGAVSDFTSVNMQKDGDYNVKVDGKLTIHGVTKDVETAAVLTVRKGTVISAKSSFKIVLLDYDIKVPTLVKDKVANEAKIDIDLLFEPVKVG